MKKNLIYVIIGALIILATGAGTFGYYYFQKYQDLENQSSQTTDTEAEIRETIRKVSRLMELPQDEAPTVATIIDRGKLSDQPFFAKTENGDKLLVYTKAKKAILYRPSTDKIIESTSVNLDAVQE